MAAPIKHRSRRGAGRADVRSAGPQSPEARRGRRDPDDYFGVPSSEFSPRARSAVMSLMDELDRLKTELSDAQHRMSELEEIADEDPLVPVLNRRGFARELERVIAYVNRYKARACVIYIDLDGFKEINDTYGHAAGDAALKFIGAYLVANVRSSDIVGRLGGDEFAIVLHQADHAVADTKAVQLEAGIAGEDFRHQDQNIDLAFSIGVEEITGKESLADLFERVDKAMFARKKSKQVSSAD